jgi:hypothetical protein
MEKDVDEWNYRYTLVHRRPGRIRAPNIDGTDASFAAFLELLQCLVQIFSRPVLHHVVSTQSGDVETRSIDPVDREVKGR